MFETWGHVPPPLLPPVWALPMSLVASVPGRQSGAGVSFLPLASLWLGLRAALDEWLRRVEDSYISCCAFSGITEVVVKPEVIY